MIPKEILDATVVVLRKHQAIRASVFGSFARGTQDAESDLDLYVELP
ncbi:MAG: nucleotidyltransferase domain-containing protein, partial [Elusimicrobia bacterium]|nr:nucleotidyltransferase domain-containing protein [Elusimicrobiota bacterium]